MASLAGSIQEVNELLVKMSPPVCMYVLYSYVLVQIQLCPCLRWPEFNLGTCALLVPGIRNWSGILMQWLCQRYI